MHLFLKLAVLIFFLSLKVNAQTPGININTATNTTTQSNTTTPTCDSLYCYTQCTNCSSKCCGNKVASGSPLAQAAICADNITLCGLTENKTEENPDITSSEGLSDEQILKAMTSHYGNSYIIMSKIMIKALMAAGAGVAGLFLIVLIFQIYWKCFRYKTKVRTDSFSEPVAAFSNTNLMNAPNSKNKVR